MMDSNACKKTTTLAVSAIIATAALITAGAIASPVLGAKSKKGASSISTKSSSSDLKKVISCLCRDFYNFSSFSNKERAIQGFIIYGVRSI